MKKRRVIITKLPQAGSGLDVKLQGLRAGLGFNANKMPWPVMAGRMSTPDVEVNSTLGPVDWSEANLEAERGETATVPDKSGIPSTFKIGGKRHSEGGTPLNLPKDSFIYSDTRDMRIKDPKILAQFGITRGGKYTPAEIARKYDINKFKKILADPDTDDIQRKTAEGMIANYNLKLAKLALIQESMKGFPQGIPRVAMPYIESMEIDPTEFLQQNPQPGEQPTVDDENQMEFGGIINKLKQVKLGGYQPDYFQDGGGKKVVQPKRSDRVIRNEQTGELEVYNWAGKKIGVMNLPPQMQQQQPVFQPQYTPPSNQQQQEQTTTTTTSPKTTKKQNIPSDAIIVKRSDYETDEDYQTARNKAVQDNKGKIVYTQTSDGSYSKVIVKKPTSGTFNTKDNLGLINQNFSDPRVQQALYDKTLAAYDKPGTLGKTPGFTKDDIIALGPEGLANQFKEMQTRNLETRELLLTKGVKYEWFDNSTGKIKSEYAKKSPYASLDDVFAQTSVGVPKDTKSKGLQQMSYIGYNDLIQDNRAGKIEDKEISSLLKPFGVTQSGVTDENLRGNKTSSISKADSYYTNTTAGQIATIPPSDEYSEEVIPGDIVPGDVETKTKHLEEPTIDHGSPWWAQDIVKTAAAAYNLANVKKYMPWQATPAVFTPGVTFESPERALAANAEQSRIAADTLGQFVGANQFNARFNQVQGQAARSAADILGQVHNRNIAISNNQEAANAAIMNRASEERAGLATGLFDKYQAVNQKFDDTKTALRDNLTNLYSNAITNRAYTRNLNEMYPQYAVDPTTGGMMYNRDPRALKPDFTKSPDFTTVYNEILKKNSTLKDHPEKVADIAMKIMGLNPSTSEDEWLKYQKNKGIVPSYPGGQGGQ